ncbi:MAG: 50S ribosomal protein L22, partial [Pseudomonadota bacterium]
MSEDKGLATENNIKDVAEQVIVSCRCTASLRKLRVSPTKLNQIARLIRRLPASEALTQLQFCRKRVANDVAKCLMSAIANAENNHNLDIDTLVVAEAYVGKDFKMRRFRPRAKGRGAPIQKFFSNIK